MTERVDIGSDVLGRNGEKLGSVLYVVVHPPDMHVTDVVVSTGAILGRDIVVPVDAIDRVADEKVYLSVDKGGLEDFQGYVEIEYKQPPQSWIPTSGFVYPVQAILWPADMVYPQITSVEVHTPPGTVELREGMDVESSDGHKVGSIAALDTDPSTDRVTGLIIKQGWIFSHDTHIPMEDVADVSSDRVKLKVTKDEVQRRQEPQRS